MAQSLSQLYIHIIFYPGCYPGLNYIRLSACFPERDKHQSPTATSWVKEIENSNALKGLHNIARGIAPVNDK
jgi:hypothetical protein